jgi:hypothetical protein
MKLSKEIWLVLAIVAFLLAWLIDRLAGPVNITVSAPIAFLKSTYMLRTYPFTATAIIIRSIGLFISTMLVVTSIMEKKYLAKILIIIFIGLLAEFFAIQQLATGFKLTTVQWTLSIAYGSIMLVLGIVWLTLKGIWSSFGGKEAAKEATGEEDSVLEPHNEGE